MSRPLSTLSWKSVALICSLTSVLTSCAVVESDDWRSSSPIRIDGSSTVYPLSEAVVDEFRSQHPEIRVTIGISGTRGGFQKFLRGETEISGASRPIQPVELELARRNKIEFIELPVAYDGIVVVVNRENTWCDSLKRSELARIWEPAAQGKILRWNQIRIGWPDEEIRLFGPGVDSGTYDYFTTAIVGRGQSSRGDFTSSEDDNLLVRGVAGDPYALGFFSYSYFRLNREDLIVVAIDAEDPEGASGAVIPSPGTISDGSYAPLSRPILIYVRKERAGRSEVARFVEFYLDHASDFVRDLGYIPLPDHMYELVRERFRGQITGSMFNGISLDEGIIWEALSKQSKR